MATLTGKTSISGFLGGLTATGGVATSNLYEVQFNLSSTRNEKLLRDLDQIGFSSLTGTATAYAMLTLLCEEASLPGMQANTGQMTGVHLGAGQVNYAHTKSFTDITLGWTCDANLLPLKFLNMWLSRHVFDETQGAGGTASIADITATNARTQVRYPDEYMCPTIKIYKGERNASDTLGRTGGIYTLYDAWPYSIQSTPLSSGASTLLKVSASFYYRKWFFEPINIRNIR